MVNPNYVLYSISLCAKFRVELLVYHLLLHIALLSLSLPHDFHVSKTELHYKSDQGALQITCNMFIDDLELALKSYSEDELKILTKFEHSSSDSLIELYLKEHLKIELNGSGLKTTYLGKEISDDLEAAWCYIEVMDCPEPLKLMVENTILLKEFDDQRNIIYLRKNKKQVAFDIFDSDKTKKEYILE